MTFIWSKKPHKQVNKIINNDCKSVKVFTINIPY